MASNNWEDLAWLLPTTQSLVLAATQRTKQANDKVRHSTMEVKHAPQRVHVKVVKKDKAIQRNKRGSKSQELEAYTLRFQKGWIASHPNQIRRLVCSLKEQTSPPPAWPLPRHPCCWVLSHKDCKGPPISIQQQVQLLGTWLATRNVRKKKSINRNALFMKQKNSRETLISHIFVAWWFERFSTRHNPKSKVSYADMSSYLLAWSNGRPCQQQTRQQQP